MTTNPGWSMLPDVEEPTDEELAELVDALWGTPAPDGDPHKSASEPDLSDGGRFPFRNEGHYIVGRDPSAAYCKNCGTPMEDLRSGDLCGAP